MLNKEDRLFIIRRAREANVPVENLYAKFSSLGGETGWLYLDILWNLRGWLDKAIGGVGMRKGQRSNGDPQVGDLVDFWRIEEVIPGTKLRLRSELKFSGDGWLEFHAQETTQKTSHLSQIAYYKPKGLLGYLYWYTLYPVHTLVFTGLARKIVEHAECAASNSKQHE
jgi:hypothetical protein